MLALSTIPTFHRRVEPRLARATSTLRGHMLLLTNTSRTLPIFNRHIKPYLLCGQLVLWLNRPLYHLHIYCNIRTLLRPHHSVMRIYHPTIHLPFSRHTKKPLFPYLLALRPRNIVLLLQFSCRVNTLLTWQLERPRRRPSRTASSATKAAPRRSVA